jgi:endonuclease YncB( thermonuclease family)
VNLVAPLLAVLLANMSPAAASDIIGTARVLDGDTVEIGSTTIRLEGIDAPESDQLCLNRTGRPWACGVEARDRLAAEAAGREWTCKIEGQDQYGRALATCAVAGQNINRWLVRHGWALAFIRYSTAYVSDERAARDARRGLWAGAFIAPWDWRRRNEQAPVLGSARVPHGSKGELFSAVSASNAPSPKCNIKANLGARGGCIFHVPGNLNYEKLRMDQPGRQWFCSVAEATAAGCRAARR